MSMTRTSSPTRRATPKFCYRHHEMRRTCPLISSRQAMSERRSRREPLGWLVDQRDSRGFDDGARDRASASGRRSAPARDSQNFFASAGRKPKIQLRRASSSGPSRAPSTRFPSPKDRRTRPSSPRHRRRNARDVARRQILQRRTDPSTNATFGGAPQPAMICASGRLPAPAAQQHGRQARSASNGRTLQDVIAADMRYTPST